MSVAARSISLGFTYRQVPEGQHICYIYSDDQERLEIMAQYMKSGQQAREKLLYLVDNMTSGQMLTFLSDSGIDFKDARPGEITVADAGSSYCPQGCFRTEEMLELVKSFYLGSREEGYAGARGTGEMGWCLAEGAVDYHDLMDYEARLNQLLREYPYTAC